MIHTLFVWSVQGLRALASALGTTYEAVNVWIFLVLWPLFTAALVVVVIAQRIRIARLTRGESPREQPPSD